MEPFVLTEANYRRIEKELERLERENETLKRDAAKYCIEHVTKLNQYRGCALCEIDRLVSLLTENKIWPYKQ
jgi:hypothetical protein